MIIIAVNGGLGNQLQQYALYEKFKSLSIPVKLDFSWFNKTHKFAEKREIELNYFPNVEYEVCTDKEREKLLCNQNMMTKVLGKAFGLKKYFQECKMYSPEIFEHRDIYLDGYWACEAYYADIIPTLWKRLIFPESKNIKNGEMAKIMKDSVSASIHIRRGDYLKPENAMFSGICTEQYYQSAISYVQQIDPDVHFYLFSDDPEYVRQQYAGNQFTVIDWNTGKDSFYDMYLMSCCRYNICANSTFSFWGARLNTNSNKKMIRPLKQKNTMIYEPEHMHKLWKDWILIDESGEIV